MAKRIRNAPARKRSLAAKKGWETRRKNARSLAAKKGWETRRKKAVAAKRKVDPYKPKPWGDKPTQAKILKQSRRERSEIVPVDPNKYNHYREGLTKDWDGRGDFDALARQCKKFFPYADGWHWAIKWFFIDDTDTGEGEEKWVSRKFESDFDLALQNIKDYYEVFTSGQMKYGLVVPLQVSVIISEGY